MLFCGIDLSFSSKNSSALVFIKDHAGIGEVISLFTLRSLEDIIEAILSFLPLGKIFIAIDAPLVILNEKGERQIDAMVNKIFRKYHAGVYPINRNIIRKISDFQVEKLLWSLVKVGFNFLKKVDFSENTIFETVVSASIVNLFNLERSLKYKAKKGRSLNLRYEEFKKYQKYIKKLENYTPSIYIPVEILSKDIENLKGKKLKEYEDILDAIICAYTAYHFWYHKGRESLILSDLNSIIVIPKRQKWINF